jgi:hypothetical protein
VATLQGHAYQIAEVADHTYVLCTDNGQWFGCWGGGPGDGPDDREICEGNGDYELANCYRCNVLRWPATACTGVYAVNGVCHQSANCFLFSADVTLDFEVRGYWFTLLAYGPYGTDFQSWLLTTYGTCAIAHPVPVPPETPEPSLGDRIRALHASYLTRQPPPSLNDLLIDEAAEVVRHFVPDLDPSTYRDLHADFLQRKDEMIASGITGERLADALNSLSADLQGALAQRVGDAMYQRVSGVPAGETLRIIEPDAAAAGLPVPPGASRG